MDSVPQELIDAIIDNLSRNSLCSSSLIAKRWRTKSQRRIFNSIRLSTEDKVNRWHPDIQRGRNRIVPYVHSVELHKISSWNEPTLPGRVLKGFLSLKTLVVHQSAIPDELLAQISRGEFGRGITTLHIRFPLCKLSAIISMIFSLPDLKDLTVSLDQTPPGRLPSTPPVAPKRGPLDRLELYHYGYEKNGITETLIQSRLTFRCLRSTCHLRNILRLLAISSETLVRLEVSGVWFLRVLDCRNDNNDHRSY